MPAISNESRVIHLLAKRYPGKGDMDLGNPKDTLLGVLLSARTKDSQVLKIYPAFKKKFPTFASLAKSTPAEIATSISTIGLYRSKAKAIHGLANKVMDEYHGKVPGTFDELVMLPGVGRKTANCVLNYVFGEDTVCVDTHVYRIARRLGWSRGTTPIAVEKDLMKRAPKRDWSLINHSFVRFGREICQPIKPKCAICPVAKWCEHGKRVLRGTSLRGCVERNPTQPRNHAMT
ncbi:MAG: endonuclease III [Patescibacteria group bacterium]